jgi:hypothetical protein
MQSRPSSRRSPGRRPKRGSAARSSSCRVINRHLARHNEIIHPQNLTKRPRKSMLSRAGIQGCRHFAPGYPPPEFRGRTRATARPVPAGRSRKQIRYPPGPSRGAPAAFVRGLRIMTRLAGRRPVAPVPEQPLVATVRHDMVHDRRRRHAASGLAGRAQRMLRQEGGSGPPPAGAVAPARCARALPVQLALHRRRALRPGGTMHRRLDRHGVSPRQARHGSVGRFKGLRRS